MKTLAALVVATVLTARADDPGVRNRYRFEDPSVPVTVYYDAAAPIGAGSKCDVAVVLIHGWGGHVRTLLPVFNRALAERAGSPDRTPYVIAPMFPRRATLKRNPGEADDGRAVWNDRWENLPEGTVGPAADDWRGGGDADGTTFSSYDYVDRIFARLCDRKLFPNLRRIVLAGFSAGGQFAGRYAAVGKGVVREGVTLAYMDMAPSTEFRFEKDDPWLYGLKDRPRYAARLSDDDIMKNLCSRRVWRGCGSEDRLGRPFTALDMSAPAVRQGTNRIERFRSFEKYLDRYPAWKRMTSFHVFEGIGHKEDLAYPTKPVLNFVFGDTAAEIPVTAFPKQGFEGAKVALKDDVCRVTFRGGETLAIRILPQGKGYGRYLVVSNTADALVIDAREAFRQGVSHLMATGGSVNPKPYWDDEAMVLSEWSGRDAAVSMFLEGADAKGIHWWRAGKIRTSPRRQAFRHTHKVDMGVKSIHFRLDVNGAGKEPIRFYGAKMGPITALDRPLPAYPKPELVFHAAFDGTAEATFAKGAAKPVLEKNLDYVSGRHGKAVKLTAARHSRLAYAVKDNVNPVCGTLAFWFKRDWNEKILGLRDGGRFRVNDYWRTLFQMPPENGKDKSGGITFWWWGPSLRLDRDDLDGRYGNHNAPPGTDWQHYVIVWDDRGTRFYRDGDVVPFGSKSDSYSPQREALKDLNLLNFNRDLAAFKTFFLGCRARGYELDGALDDVKIWSGPMDGDEARALYAAELDAHLAPDAWYALADEKKAVKLDVKARADVSLAGVVPELVDRDGKVVATGTPLGAKGGVSSFDLALPAGEYSFRLPEARHLLYRPTSYWVLRAGNPVELPPTATPGLPAEKKLLATVRPDLATLTPDRFRSVGTCRMGSLGGTRYLEAGPKAGDRFAIRFAVPTNAPLCLFEIDYPDDAERTQDIIVQTCKRRGGGDYNLQVGVFGGAETKATGRILTHRCLYWTPKTDDVALVMMTARAKAPAAVAEIRLYEIPGAGLPQTAVREAPALPDGWRRTFGSYWEDPAINYDFSANHDTAESLATLIERKAALMKYCGQDTLCYPGAWYHGLIGHGTYNPRRHSAHFLQAWFEKFDREGLYILPTVNQQTVPFPADGCTRAKMNDGSLHPTAIAIWDTGKPSWGGWHGQPPNFNIQHPDVCGAFEREFDALIADGRGHRSFRGICLHLTSITCPWWGSLTSGYNDYTVDAFMESLKGSKGLEGLKAVDRTASLRGREYARIIKDDPELLEKWITWRCEWLTAFYAKLAAKLAAADPSLRLYVNAMPNVKTDDPDYGEKGHMRRILREAGIDFEMLAARIPNLAAGDVLYPVRWRKHGAPKSADETLRAKIRDFNANPAFYEPMCAASYRWVNFHDMYWESPIGAGRTGKDILTCDWLDETPWRVTTINPSGDHAMRDYAQALGNADIQAFSRGGFLVGVYGMEDRMARFAQAFRALPAVPFETLATGDVVLRGKAFGGRTWSYAVNTTAEERSIRVKLPARTVDLVTGERLGGLLFGATVELTLPPYSLRSFSAPSGFPTVAR